MAETDFSQYLPILENGHYYVPPGTDIFILKGVPLDNTYEHTIVWEDLDPLRKKQSDYFLSKARIPVLENTYQRISRDWLKVGINAEHLINCNYMMIRNETFATSIKWYYAFIIEVEYINNNTSKIHYELDVMQTWLPGQYFDYQILPCFVERCHAKSDALYENLVPESIVNSYDYVVDYSQSYDMNKLSIVVLTTEEYSGQYDIGGGGMFDVPDGVMEFNSYGKVSYRIFETLDWDGNPNLSQLRELDNYLNAYVKAGKQDSVISIFMCPSEFAFSGQNALTKTVEIPKPMPGQPLGGRGLYVPTNNKLYSYPFNAITINNQSGAVRTYKWELFNDESRGKFTVAGVPVWMPCVTIYPNNYRNVSKNMEESISFDGFAICPWGNDAFRAWWAQNAGHLYADAGLTIASTVAAIAGMASANPMLTATGIGGAISGATKIGTSIYQGEHQPTQMKGKMNTSLILPALKNLRFLICKESLKSEMLRIYDDYFSRYGYAQKRTMIPPMLNREHWTYVQTIGFEFNGEINDTDTKKIKSIFDNGITFWRNPNEIGHYELTNNPLL